MIEILQGMCRQAIVHVNHVCTIIGVLHKETEWRMHLGSEVELETPNELTVESDEEKEAMSTEEQVQEAVNYLSSARDVEVQLRLCDRTEEELVAQFFVPLTALR